MVNFQSTPGLTDQDAKQVVSHFSSMCSNKLKLGAISSGVISAELVLFYQPPPGAWAKCAFSWNRSILEVVWICMDRQKKKAGTGSYEPERKGGFIEGSVGWNTPHFFGLIAVKVAANNRERWFSGLTLCQQWPPVLIDLRGDGCSSEDFMFCYPFYPPSCSHACVAQGASDQPDGWKQNCPRLNGSYWVYVRVKVLSECVNHSGRMEAHGSLLFDLSLTPEALL